jgi:hypothetical protein
VSDLIPGALRSTQIPPPPSSLKQRRRNALRQDVGESWTQRLPEADVLYQPTQQGAPDRVPLWDVIDGTWTPPLDESHAFKYYLKKTVFKCSACAFADLRFDSVETHVELLYETVAVHAGAKIENQPKGDGTTVLGCSACTQSFQGRPGRAYEHLFDIEQDAQAHQGAVSQVIRRFSLEPVELPSPAIVKHTNGHGQHPGTRAGEELRVRSVHKRKRGKRGGKKHG